MRTIIALLVIVYLVGIGVVLWPMVKDKWSSVPASELTASVVQELPNAFAWPVRAYHGLTNRG